LKNVTTHSDFTISDFAMTVSSLKLDQNTVVLEKLFSKNPEIRKILIQKSNM